MSHARHPRARRWILAGVLTPAALWAGWVAYRVITATPAPVIDYGARHQQLSGNVQPEGENGWGDLITLLNEAVDLERAWYDEWMAASDGSGRPPDLTRLFARDLATIDTQEERALLDRLRAAGIHEKLDVLASRPRFVRPLAGTVPPLMVNAALPEMQHFRLLARARTADMRLAADAGDDAERVRAFEHALFLARVCMVQTTLIDRLVGLANHAMVTQELMNQLADAPIAPDTAVALAAAHDRQMATTPTVVHALEGERLAMHDFIQWAYTDDGHGDGHLDPDRWRQFGPMTGTAVSSNVLGRFQTRLLAGRRATREKIDEGFDGFQGNVAIPPADRARLGFDENLFFQRLGPRHRIAELLLPAIGKVVSEDDLFWFRVRHLHLTLAIEAYRGRHGAPPVALDDLVTDGLIDAVPADPFSPAGWCYHPVPLFPDRAWPPYALYSTGIDGVDDLAAAETPADRALAIATLPRTAGTDLVRDAVRHAVRDE